MTKAHKHKWMVICDGDTVEAICYADQEAGKGIITAEQLLRGDFPDLCKAKLSRAEIEERLNAQEK